MINTKQHCLVLDIGKTHVKLHVLDSEFNSVIETKIENIINKAGEYPSANTELIWQWLITGIKEVTADYDLSAISITTHGATAAIIDRHSSHIDGLVLPILDYEYSFVDSDYAAVRPDYSETYSPDLTAGLNLGRQLHWLQKNNPKDFAKATDILMYPQYWVWRLTGQCYSEITSLGCHTDLWSIEKHDFSSLVDTMGWRHLFPQLVPAWTAAGNVTATLCEQLGLSADCKVHVGIHDSNASFLRYCVTMNDQPFTVISTGTWTILMASGVELKNLDPDKDMLANIDVTAKPVACARIMGGREFRILRELSGSNIGTEIDENYLQAVIDNKVFALPDFSEGSGPFAGNESQIIGPVSKIRGLALASIYCALMMDYQLDMLGAEGNIYIEGAFLKNPLLCAVLAQLRQSQITYLSADRTGTVSGTAYLARWHEDDCEIKVVESEITALSDLQSYRDEWRKLVVSKPLRFR
jgi:sugar (pentulose or hexulose) kinase